MSEPSEPTREEMLAEMTWLIGIARHESAKCLPQIGKHHKPMLRAIRRLVEKYGDKPCEKNTIDSTEKKS